MLNLPVVRLSQALYTDAPTKLPSNRWRPAPSRKRVLDKPQQIEQLPRARNRKRGLGPCSIRLLLPRSFAVADRAYHDAAGARERASSTTREPKTKLTFQCKDALLEHSPPVSNDGTSSINSHTSAGSADTTENVAEIARASGCGLEHCTKMLDVRCQPVQLESAAEEEPFPESVVAVESVLGFAAVRALLERLYTGSGATHCSPDVGDRSTLLAVPDLGTTEALRRLIAWLRLAEATTALDGSMVSVGSSALRGRYDVVVGTDRCRTAEGAATVVRQRTDNEVLAAALPPGEEADHTYAVTGRCEAGSEWSVFYLEPTGAGNNVSGFALLVTSY